MRELRGMVFTSKDCFEPGSVLIADGRILSVKTLDLSELTDVECERYILPGLVDIHMHGAMGVDVCKAALSEDYEKNFQKLAEYERSRGVTSFCPATMTLSLADLKKICKNLEKAAKSIPAIKGIYLEGPFISEEKCGAQNKEYIIRPDAEAFRELDRAAGGLIKFLVIAPEKKNALETIEALSKEKTLCLGHSTADYELAFEAFDKGASQVTHLYNAMNCGSPREPGIPGAAAEFETARVEIIADGAHLHPVTVKNAFKLFENRVILISDSTEATGMTDGEYMLGDNKIYKSGTLARLENGTLAGSASSLYDCLLSALKMGVNFESAIVSASKIPAQAAGIFNRVGSLEVGKDADLIIMNRNYEIEEVICNE